MISTIFTANVLTEGGSYMVLGKYEEYGEYNSMSISRITMCEKEKQPEECEREFLFLIMKTIKVDYPAQCLDIYMTKQVNYGSTVKLGQALKGWEMKL